MEDKRKRNRENFRQLGSDIATSAWQTPAAIGTHLAGMPIGGLTGLLDLLTGKGSEAALKSIQNPSFGIPYTSYKIPISYRPTSPATQASLGAIGEATEILDKPLQAVGDFAAGSESQRPLLGAAAYAAANLLGGALSIPKLAGTATMGAAKGLRASRLKIDPVDKTAKFVGKSRYSVSNPALGQLITREQLAGEQAGVVQSRTGYRPSGTHGWYGSPLDKVKHLVEMGKQASYRNPINRFLSSQDAHLRDKFGITGNVFRELERLKAVMDHAKTMKGDAPYTHHITGDKIRAKGKDKYKSATTVASEAAEQFHSQLAYNASILNKFNPTDPRIKNLTGGLEKLLTPRNRQVNMDKIGNRPDIISDIMQLNHKNKGLAESFGITSNVIKNHIARTVKSDNKLNRDKIHLSSKPIFGSVRHGMMQGEAKKVDLDYGNMMRDVIVKLNKTGKPWGKREFIEVVSKFPKYYNLKRISKDLVDSDGYLSINQSVRLQDPLLATVQVRTLMRKSDPEHGLYVITDQMKQGSGLPMVEQFLDLGSDINRLYMDVQPFKIVGEASEAGSVAMRNIEVDGYRKPTKPQLATELAERVMPRLRKKTPDEYVRAHQRKRINPYSRIGNRVAQFQSTQIGPDRV
jgi:hypothetical protein